MNNFVDQPDNKTGFTGVPERVYLTAEELPSLPDGYRYHSHPSDSEIGVLLANCFPDLAHSTAYWRQQRIQLSIQGNRDIYVAVSGERPGLAGFGRIAISSDAAELCDLGVRYGDRGRGLGRAITETRLALAAKLGVRSLYVHELSGSNQSRVYQERGFTRTDSGAWVVGTAPRLIVPRPVAWGPMSTYS